jgi:hypothetical protein
MRFNFCAAMSITILIYRYHYFLNVQIMSLLILILGPNRPPESNSKPFCLHGPPIHQLKEKNRKEKYMNLVLSKNYSNSLLNTAIKLEN